MLVRRGREGVRGGREGGGRMVSENRGGECIPRASIRMRQRSL